MARWNHQPKYKVVRLDAYSFIRNHARLATDTLKATANNNRDVQLYISKVILRMQQMAAMFTPVKQMSPASKELLTFYYKNSAVPFKVHLMQLDGKRVEVK